MAGRDQLSLRELELLQELNEIAAKTDQISNSVGETSRNLDQKDLEIAALKKELEICKEENARLRKLIQTWKSRMDNVLKQLGQYN